MSTVYSVKGIELERIYPSPSILEEVGPLVNASWAVPAKSLPRNPYLRASIPAPVSGLLAIDTGSNRTWISREVVEQLDLTPFTEETAHGSIGLHKTPIYLAELVVPFAGLGQDEVAMTSTLAVAAVPGLSEVMPLYEGDEPVRIIGLLGRDFLRHVTFTYDGPRGRFQLLIDGRALEMRSAHP